VERLLLAVASAVRLLRECLPAVVATAVLLLRECLLRVAATAALPASVVQEDSLLAADR